MAQKSTRENHLKKTKKSQLVRNLQARPFKLSEFSPLGCENTGGTALTGKATIMEKILEYSNREKKGPREVSTTASRYVSRGPGTLGGL